MSKYWGKICIYFIYEKYIFLENIKIYIEKLFKKIDKILFYEKDINADNNKGVIS